MPCLRKDQRSNLDQGLWLPCCGYASTISGAKCTGIKAMLKYAWRVIAKALGDKAHPNSKVANHVASVRFMILVAYMTTNAFICAGVIRHWNN